MHDYPRFDLEGRTVLVTGAARGLGRAISLAMARAGADVCLGLRDGAGAADLEAEISAMGRRAMRVSMDVRDLGQIEVAVRSAVESLGRLDILVNNAGLGPANPAENVTEADYDLTMEVNVKGVFFASQACGRVMIEQGYGRIVGLSSQAGFVALPTESVYQTAPTRLRSGPGGARLPSRCQIRIQRGGHVSQTPFFPGSRAEPRRLRRQRARHGWPDGAAGGNARGADRHPARIADAARRPAARKPGP